MLKVGLVQTRTPATQVAALAHVAPLIREAAAAGATLIVTPECTNIVQRDRAKLFAVLAPAESDPVVTGLTALARELGVWLVIGSALVRREDGKAANRSILVAPDGSGGGELRQDPHVRCRPAQRRALPRIERL